jgi:predicted Holliday junction resolvase-like endonuclease
MKHNEVMQFFQYQREIFGVCPCCGEFFRLSDCKVYKDGKKTSDWLDRINRENLVLDKMEEQINADLEFYKELAREEGRKLANRKMKKVDKVFSPKKLNPDDAKVLFHPVDYVVFNGMKLDGNGKQLKSIILLDAERKNTEQKQIQKSIIKAVESEKYEWITLRVREDGGVTEE